MSATIVKALATPPAQHITLPYPPSANRYWRSWRGRMVVSDAAKTYKLAAWMVAQSAGIHPLAGDVAISVHVYRPARRGDVDNSLKVLLDALIGVAYQDDSQIVELHVWRHDDKRNPRAEVEIAPACVTEEAE